MKRKKIFLILSLISLLLVIATAIMIFVFSSESGTKSTQTSNTVTETVIKITQPDFDTLPVDKQEERFSITSLAVRKIAHFTEFFMLGLFSLLHIKFLELYMHKEIRFSYLYASLFSFLYAISDELHQKLSENRGPQFIDVLIDTSGALLAIVIVFIIFLIIKKRKIIKHLEQA